MGFFKKIKKAVKKVTKPIEKIVKPVAKNILPIASNVVGSALGDYTGGFATKGLESLFGKNAITSGLGKSVGSGISNTFNQFAQSIAGYNSPSGGVSMPNYYQGSNSPGTIYGVPSSGYNTDFTSGVSQIKNVETPIKSAAEQGKDTRDYLAAAYPEMNPWERSGTGGTMFGSEMTGDIMTQENLNKQLANSQALQKQQLMKDIAIAQLGSDTQLAINTQNNQTALQAAYLNSQTSMYNTGVQSQTSRQNTMDNVQLGYKNTELAETRLNADIGKIQADTDLSKQNKEESIARVIKNYAEVNNLRLSADQIRALTKQALSGAALSASQAGLVGEQTRSERYRQPGILQTNENLRYGTGNLSREAQSVGNMVSDAASSTWDWFSSMFSDSDGVKGSMSRK